MPIDPNIALAYRGVEVPNQLAQYAQLSQIQNAQNQNRMADMQMQEYARARQEEEGSRNYLRGKDINAPEVQAGLLQYGKTGLGLAQSIATQRKSNVDLQSSEFKLANEKIDHGWKSLGNAPTPEAAVKAIQDGVKRGYFSEADAKAELAQIPLDPEAYKKYRIENILKLVDAKDKLAANLPNVKQQEAGGQIVNIQNNPMMSGYGLPVAGMAPIQKTATIADTLARQKFEWEKANPGYELKETEDGNIVGVNKRTLQAVPVTMGGAAPAAALGMPGMGMPGVGMPGARTPAPTTTIPAISGMTSVLDQRVPAQPTGGPAGLAAGTPLIGKGAAMTEHQSKSAMFGGAMTQANKVISQVEKDGTTTAPVVMSVLQGLARLSPEFLGTGENVANAIESVFRQDPSSILGPDVNQQKLGQAQIAFATAYLRATSGAAFGPSEVSNTIKEYFPLIGEDKAVVKQKADARLRAIEGMRISTSKQGQKYMENIGSGGINSAIPGANANDPLGLGLGIGGR